MHWDEEQQSGDEFGGQALLERVADRPLLAVVMVLACWLIVVFALALAYAALA